MLSSRPTLRSFQVPEDGIPIPIVTSPDSLTSLKLSPVPFYYRSQFLVYFSVLSFLSSSALSSPLSSFTLVHIHHSLAVCGRHDDSLINCREEVQVSDAVMVLN